MRFRGSALVRPHVLDFLVHVFLPAMVSPYVPHAIYGMAILSISIHLVNAKKTAEEDRTRLQSRESILGQIRDQLKVEGKGVNWEEVDRLKRLARPVENDGDRLLPEVKLSWTDVFYGRKLPKEGDELSEWERKDLEKLRNAFNEEKDKS
ncbi:hypothetical protein FA13DRAFT_720295 [Coprinellus micaceus]|uniref:Uncharacterized protein n=1 Tax=Coprinellus micaceus TaxID=71717 RepID=A0A4Y7TV63_COPMI|nr:hypothetical protein FA13DRAFT_720295 [Coprinellus micaceus]